MLPTSDNGYIRHHYCCWDPNFYQYCTQVTASNAEVPISVAKLNQDNASAVEMNQVPTSVAIVRQPLSCA